MDREVVELLKELIRIETVDSQHGEEVGELLAEWVGVKPTVVPSGNVKNFIFKKGKGRPVVAFYGHYDVVPAEGWEGAFQPREEGERLIGRGAGDMKGGLTALAEAFRGIEPEEGSLLFLVVGDEEQGGQHGARAVAERVEVDYFISGESTGLSRMRVGRRGVLQLLLKLHSQGCHAARPTFRCSPIYALPLLLSRLLQLEVKDREDMVKTTIAITSVECPSTANNVHATECRVGLDIRYNHGNRREELVGQVKDILSSLPFPYSVEELLHAEPFRNREKRLEEALRKVVRERLGMEVEASTGGGSSDARFFAYKGIPIVEYGPEAGNKHAKGEWVSLKDVLALPSLYKALYEELIDHRRKG